MNKFISKNNIIKISLIAFLGVGLLISLCSCTGNKSTRDDKTLNVCEASEPQSVDPALSTTVDGAIMILHTFEGLGHYVKNDAGEVVVEAALCDELVEPTENSDGTYTYVYHLNKDAKWSDGVPVTAKDYVYGWNRACSVELASDFSYLFDIVKGYDDIWGDEPVDGAKLDIEAVDDYTFKVVTTQVVPYWNQLMAFAVFLPVREDIVDDEGMWATKPETFISNGPFHMTDWRHNSYITIEKNEYYPLKDNITMEKINFYLSDNNNNMLANFLNGDWDHIKDIPTNELQTIKKNHPEYYHCDPNAGTYYLSWSTLFDISPLGGNKLTNEQKAEVRQAISLLIDRNYICEDICKSGQVPASSYVPLGIPDSKNKEFSHSAGKAGNPYYGYFPTAKEGIKDNYNKALEILHKYYNFDENGYITNFPQLTYLYNTNESHKAIAEYIQSVLSGIGISMSLENQEWATFLSTRKLGDFSLCRCSWISDYSDATCFLNLFTSTSANNDAWIGKGADADNKSYSIDLSDVPGYQTKSVQNSTWANTYDVLCKYISTENNYEVRDHLCHKAEDLLMSTGCITPVYYYSDSYLLQPNIKNFFSNSNGFKFFMYTTKE